MTTDAETIYVRVDQTGVEATVCHMGAAGISFSYPHLQIYLNLFINYRSSNVLILKISFWLFLFFNGGREMQCLLPFPGCRFHIQKPFTWVPYCMTQHQTVKIKRDPSKQISFSKYLYERWYRNNRSRGYFKAFANFLLSIIDVCVCSIIIIKFL